MALSGEPEFRTITQLRRDALEQDLLLFCLAFSGGAALYAIVRAILEGASGGDFWAIGISEGLFLSGLIAGEVFLFWDLGIRQGVRGHSVGKHRVGLVVADVATREPVGLVRGAIRGHCSPSCWTTLWRRCPWDYPRCCVPSRRTSPDTSVW